MRAGIPTVIFPLLVDQPFWAARAAALGVGPPAVCHLRDLTADTLRAQITAADSPAVRTLP
jgi:UDP:flavonoid glycosyltransferase YjiC (YdhE family)